MSLESHCCFKVLVYSINFSFQVIKYTLDEYCLLTIVCVLINREASFGGKIRELLNQGKCFLYTKIKASHGLQCKCNMQRMLSVVEFLSMLSLQIMVAV
jgi:hypothetical protein